MAYKTYAEQVEEHLFFLHEQGLPVEALEFGRWVRISTKAVLGCEEKGRRFEYRTDMKTLNNGLCGFVTTVHAPGGQCSFRTYGLFDKVTEAASRPTIVLDIPTTHEEAARKAYGFWAHCSLTGRSPYLEAKGVCGHGLRFRHSDKYGDVAVVPMKDEYGKLWSYQLLNPDGSKIMAKEGRTVGLFHLLGTPTGNLPVGVAEGYATAATCHELFGIPIFCTFSADNIVHMVKSLLTFSPATPIFIFADNDRHLSTNKGVSKANEAAALNSSRIRVVIPDFGDIPPSKTASDWNDLVRLRGEDEAGLQVLSKWQGVYPNMVARTVSVGKDVGEGVAQVLT